MTNEDLSKLTYLAQAVVGEPSRFDAFVNLIRRNADTSDAQGKDRSDFAQAIDELVKAWKKRFGDDTPSTSEVVALAHELEGKRKEAVRLVGIALSWAAENQLWRRQVERDPLNEQDVKTLNDLSDRAASPGF